MKYKQFIFLNALSTAVAILFVLFSYTTFSLEGVSLWISWGLLILSAVFIHMALQKPILEPFFEKDEKLDTLTKKTLHELNIPIATIKANLQMIQKTPLDEKTKKRLSRIEDASEQMLHLYEEMEYAIKKEIKKVSKERFNAKLLILEVIERFEESKGAIAISTHLNPLHLYTDKKAFSTVVSNLLSNAIKYNKPNGTITVTLVNNQLSIKDTGIGMDSSELLHIHEKHYQINHEKQGMGLGLNMVKDFCDKHGVALKITSEKNVGTTVFLDLQHLTDN